MVQRGVYIHLECFLLVSILPNFFLRKTKIFFHFSLLSLSVCSMRKYCLYFEIVKLKSKNQKNEEIRRKRQYNNMAKIYRYELSISSYFLFWWKKVVEAAVIVTSSFEKINSLACQIPSPPHISRTVNLRFHSFQQCNVFPQFPILSYYRIDRTNWCLIYQIIWSLCVYLTT